MYISAALLLLSAAAVSAHPSGNGHHAHLHRRLHAAGASPPVNQERSVGDIVTATIDGKVVSWVNTYDGSPFQKNPPPAPAATTPATTAPAPTTTTTTTTTTPTPTATPASNAAPKVDVASSGIFSFSSSYGGHILTKYEPLCGGTSSKRATLAEINAAGNTGTTWGCDIAVAANADVAGKYPYRIKFQSVDNQPYECKVWNKIGPAGGITGQSSDGAVSFGLPANGEVWVVFEAGVLGAAACFVNGNVQRAPNGILGSAWVEFTINDETTHWSAADVSVINTKLYGLPFPGVKLFDISNPTVAYSTLTPSGIAEHAYLTAADPDGLGINTPATDFTWVAQYGWSG